jgi:hypothetical protein
MKKLSLFVCIILVLALLPLTAQDKSPAVVFENQVADHGTVTEGQVIKHIFKFANKGSAVLEILKVESS